MRSFWFFKNITLKIFFYLKKINHGFHFIQHPQLFQCMLYRSLHYIFSTTVLTCYSTLCTTHVAWQLYQDRMQGSKPQICTGILGGYGDKHKNKVTAEELQSYMCIIHSILLSLHFWSSLTPELQISSSALGTTRREKSSGRHSRKSSGVMERTQIIASRNWSSE